MEDVFNPRKSGLKLEIAAGFVIEKHNALPTTKSRLTPFPEGISKATVYYPLLAAVKLLETIEA